MALCEVMVAAFWWGAVEEAAGREEDAFMTDFVM